MRLWLADGDRYHGELCPGCILSGPRGAAERLRTRIRARERMRLGRMMEASFEEWSEWMYGRARLLESMEYFPLAARQAAIREMRETR
jgi:hypothetical protein